MNYIIGFVLVSVAAFALRTATKSRKEPAYKFFAQKSLEHHYMQSKKRGTYANLHSKRS
jgi:hypothetical protein